MQFSKEQIEKASAAASAEELLEMARAAGIELTEEDAKHYYNVLHEEMLSEEQLRKLTEEELANISGGSQCKGGKTYSSDYPYYLITTAGNHCPGYTEGQRLENGFGIELGIKGTCWHCAHEISVNWITYCKIRTINNDPYR